jgi:hypothetical protein
MAAQKRFHSSLIFTFYFRVHTIFGNSTERWKLLSREGTISTARKRPCPTRLPSRNDEFNAVRFRFIDMLKDLTMITLHTTKSEGKAEAIYIRKNTERF